MTTRARMRPRKHNPSRRRTNFKERFASGNFSDATEELREHIPTLQGGFVLALAHGNAAASLKTSGALD